MVTYKTAYKNPVSRYIWIIGLDVRNPSWCEKFIIPPGSIKEGFQL